MKYIAGMDIGAISVKTMIISELKILATSIFEAGASPKETAVGSLLL